MTKNYDFLFIETRHLSPIIFET